MTEELVPAPVRADTGYQLLTLPRRRIWILLLDASVIFPFQYGLVHTTAIRARPDAHKNTSVCPQIEQAPTVWYSTSVSCLCCTSR